MKPARKITNAMLAGVAERLFPKGKLDPETGCIVWQGSRTRGGYGRITIRGASWPAHRIAHAIAKSIPRPDELVRHKCDNPPCINPDHLELGDALANARDRVERGREPDRRGEGNGRCRLTERDIRQIRKSPLGYKRLARLYGVGRTTIRDVRNGQSWVHVQ